MAQRYVGMGLLAAVGLQLLGAELGSTAAALNCKTDADCGGAPATCELTTYETCAGKDPACPAGSACGEKPTMPNQADCAPYVEGICRRPDEQPCQVDADCGIGFRCAEQIGMACMGSGSTGSPGAAPSWHEECHVSRGTFVCELNETTCSRDGDCAAGLSCQQTDTNFCYKRTCDVDPACASGLRCQQNKVSFCWTSFASPTNPDAARAIDACMMSPRLLCAPRGYFDAPDLKLPDGGVGSSVDSDDGDNNVGGSASNEHPTLSGDEETAADAGDQGARAGGDGCSLVGRTRAARAELSWVALLGLLAMRRRRRARIC